MWRSIAGFGVWGDPNSCIISLSSQVLVNNSSTKVDWDDGLS